MLKRILISFCLMLLVFNIQIAFAIVSDKNIDFNERIALARVYCKANKMNVSYCIFVDMNVHSGKNRMYVYDFKNDKIIISGLCAHGNGGGSSPHKAVYSNRIGSNCTSLGKYKIGKRAYSNWGINVHYKMHGLEKSNDNAYKRIIVLHSYTPVPSFETAPIPLFNVSEGCPVVANKTMRQIDQLIQTGQKNMLLWIYE